LYDHTFYTSPIQENDMQEPPLTAEGFWSLLETSTPNLIALCRQLEQLSPTNLWRYQCFYEHYKRTVNPYYDWEECGPHILKWELFSEDGADDFSAWVVMRGQPFLNEVRSRPQSVQRYIDLFQEDVEMGLRPELTWNTQVDRSEYQGYQSPDCIAAGIYRVKFGRAMPELEDLD
jgi:hypothetical protein